VVPLLETGLTRFTPLREVAQVFVVLVSYNTAQLIHRCIGHLRAASAGLRVSVVIVDNASRDESVALLRRSFADCEVIENSVNIGFGRANNQAMPLCNAPLVLLLNPDAYVSEGALDECLRHMDREPQCGVLGLRLVDEAGNGNSSARDFPNVFRSFAINTGLIKHKPDDLARAGSADFVNCDWVTGCFYLVRRTTIEEVGLFDPRYFLYFEEVDHCRAVKKAGWNVHCLLTYSVVHEGGASARSDGDLTANGQLLTRQIESELFYYRKHNGLAGLLMVLILGLATDALLCTKILLRDRSLQQFHNRLSHSRELCRIALITRGVRGEA
jgi:hypothetical protein